MNTRRLIWLLAALLALAATVWWLFVSLSKPSPPMDVALWYWHQPFRVPPDEAKALRAAGVTKLFVRGATFRLVDGAPKAELLQTWATPAREFEVHVVLNFGYDVIRQFPSLDNARLADTILAAASEAVSLARKAGVRVDGVQMDFDCPTSRLPKYAALLGLLRPRLRELHVRLSATALPTWFTSRDVDAVLQQLDFVCPQYYEARTTASAGSLPTISRLSLVSRGMRAAGRTGCRFYAGIPCYGHALVFRGQRILGMYRDQDAAHAVRDPQFHFVRSFAADQDGRPATPATAIGEDMVEFSVQGGEYRVVYSLPTPSLVARHLALVRRERPGNCLGVALFRYPEPGEMMTLPMPSLLAELRGERASPRLSVKLSYASLPWEAVETPGGRVQTEVTVRVWNVGNAPTFFAPDAVTVTLRLDRPCLTEVSPGRFDSVETLSGGSASSVLRADTVRLRAFWLAPGQEAVTRLVLSREAAVSGDWVVRSPDGFSEAKDTFGARQTAQR